METFQHNMNEEKRPPTLLPEGARLVRITELIKGTSKNGNEMFTATIEDIKTRKSMAVYLVAVPKKRWLLKTLLTAVGSPASEDGIYSWSKTDVLGKTVIAIVDHFQEPWIDTDGKETMQTKCQVSEFLAPDNQVKEATNNKWEE